MNKVVDYMEAVTLMCDVMYKDEIVGRLEIVDGQLIKNEVYTDVPLKHPFPKHKSFFAIAEALSGRVFCRERFVEEMQRAVGLTEYNVYDIMRNTHGADVDDHIWFRYDGEDLCWDDVKPINRW